MHGSSKVTTFVYLVGLINFTADEPCGRECSFGCAVVNSTEQCFCPTGYELSAHNNTECVGK